MVARHTLAPKSLKVKFASANEALNGMKSCENDISKRKIQSSVHGLKDMFGGSHAGGETVEDPSLKRKMNRGSSRQCSVILKALMHHPNGWPFVKPVDPVQLNIPDYFSIISHPMDLGTVKFKLEKNMYGSKNEVADDIRLTFSNAMLYNPPDNPIHKMAKELKAIFESKWLFLDQRWLANGLIPEDLQALSGEGTDVSSLKNLQQTTNISVPQKRKNLSTLKVKLTKPAKSSMNVLSHEATCMASNGDTLHVTGSANTDPNIMDCPSKHEAQDERYCRIEEIYSSHSNHLSCGISPETSISSAKSVSVANLTCTSDKLALESRDDSISTSQTGNSDPVSEDAATASEDGGTHSSSELAVSSAFMNSEEGSGNGQLSPRAALRALHLKQRFADTILKARHKTLNDTKVDSLTLQREKEMLEKKQREEKAKIEAQIKAAKEATRKRLEEELRVQREKEREASRLALLTMERSVEIEENQLVLRELESIAGLSFNSGRDSWSPLEKLGLFMKDDMPEEDDLFLTGIEDGEILL